MHEKKKEEKKRRKKQSRVLLKVGTAYGAKLCVDGECATYPVRERTLSKEMTFP